MMPIHLELGIVLKIFQEVIIEERTILTFYNYIIEFDNLGR